LQEEHPLKDQMIVSSQKTNPQNSEHKKQLISKRRTKKQSINLSLEIAYMALHG